MSIKINYLGLDILVDERTAKYGGSFNYNLTVYEVDKVELIRDHLKTIKNPVLIDVGASTGSFALLPLVVNGLMVYSFEPSKAFDVLLNNIQINNISNRVKAINQAVSDIEGIGLFYEVQSQNDSCLALSMLGGKPSSHKKTKEYSVKVTTIDKYCQNIKVDVLKIDVEGGELNVLKGALKTIERDKPLIMFEFSDENANQYGYNHQSCIDLLDSIGYDSKRTGGDVVSIYKP